MIDSHRGAFEYDWRARFSLPLDVVGRSMRWGEALRLARMLAVDPTSQLGAALAGWDHPVSREALVLMDIFDLEHIVAWAQGGGKGAKPRPYPRPWSMDSGSKRVAPDPSLSHEQIVAALRRAGHTAPIPERR